MKKQILDVGNCTADHAAMVEFLTAKFDCQVSQAHGAEDTFTAVKKGDLDLVLVNRKIDRDYSDGAKILGSGSV